ncbi:hypothetical protein [Flagellimonas sp.]|uniref:hypothetical protein n=1 Tax=Flagellimonas sp. TaxID=2058762 RepID=UPI003F4A64A6
MKLLHNINKWSYAITLLLYITIYLGMIAQIVLGIIQVFLAIIMFSRFSKLDSKTRFRLKIYSVLTLLYLLAFVVWNILDIPSSDSISLVGIAVPPMALATFFVFITHKAKLAHLQDDLPPPIS